MASQWDNFLCNLGEWHGTFANLAVDGSEREVSRSCLCLEQEAGERLVHFRLLRYPPGQEGGEPSRQVHQEYRSLGRQVVFFDSGSFCKGSLQVAPGTAFGAEFGFLAADRRHRLVQLHDPKGAFEGLVLIREHRAGTPPAERPPLAWDDLEGTWSGEAATVVADWPEASRAPCRFTICRQGHGGIAIAASPDSPPEAGGGDGDRALLLPDGGYFQAPAQVSHRHAFAVEAGWLPAPDRLERLIRRYDASGAWQSATWIQAHRHGAPVG